jgi:hypothetical protein
MNDFQLQQYSSKLKLRLATLRYQQGFYNRNLERMVSRYESVLAQRALFLHLRETNSAAANETYTKWIIVELRLMEDKLIKTGELEQAKLKVKLLAVNAELRGIYKHFKLLTEGSDIQIDDAINTIEVVWNNYFL